MTLFYIMRVLWNTKKYRMPSGVAATKKTYPGKWGFGHEEWNNSPMLHDKETNQNLFSLNKFQFPLHENGNLFIFMYADHGQGTARKQDLVGIAGKATYLSQDEQGHFAGRLRLNSFPEQAWSVDRVKHAHGNDRQAFNNWWNSIGGSKPNWKSPSETYLWLGEPVSLDPTVITGSRYFSLWYNRAQKLESLQARKIMEFVAQSSQTSPAWNNLCKIIDASNPNSQPLSLPQFHIGSGAKDSEEKAADIQKVLQRSDLTITERTALIDARVGQGQFRQSLESLWGGSCAVTGCNVREMLRASHIKPWRACTDGERLDPNNGLLLIANLDALFDKRLISFDQFGQLRTSTEIMESTIKQFKIFGRLRLDLNQWQLNYLQWHFESCGRNQGNNDDDDISDDWCHGLFN